MRMDEKDLERVPSEPGSRASTEPVPVSAASGFDPSRWHPISTAPKDGRPLLLKSAEGYIGFGVMRTENSVYTEDTWVREDVCWLGKRPYEAHESFWMGGLKPSEAVYWSPLVLPCDSDGNPEGGDRRAPGEA